MAKYKNITESNKRNFIEKIFYYLGKGMKPMVIKKMAKKDPKFANIFGRIEKDRKELDKMFSDYEKKYGK
tara:strand:+ start:103 stop:312 length:210 start_codon:yes stop_codon:yes gene_type:complete